MEKVKRIIKRILGRREESVADLRRRGVKIGDNVQIINSHIDLGHGFLLSIGNNVIITNSTILTHDASTKLFIGYSKVGEVKIGDNVFMGFGSIVLPNTRIGSNVIIGAGTIVTRDVPDNSVIVGNPPRKICSFDEYIEKNEKNLTTNPVFNTYWPNKKKAEVIEMQEQLKGIIGYDI